MAWSDADDAFVREHYNRDLSASQIGVAMGRTKGSIIGRARILGLHQHRVDPSYSHYRPTVTSLLARPALAPRIVQTEKPKPKPKPVSIVPLGSISPWKTCQWMHGEPSERDFCGAATVAGSSWCAHHYEIVFNSRPPTDTAAQAEPLLLAEAA